jgi:glycosyltransferase involved in cell wall biosynthesis
LFLIRGLHVGGAERQLVATARGLRRRGHETGVAVFYGGGPFEEELRREGVVIHHLRKRGRWDIAPFLARLVRLVRSERPDVLHAYMVPPNILSGILKPLFPPLKVVWGVRTGNADLSAYDWLASVARDLEGRASGLADAIVANSDTARSVAIRRGMDPRKIVVIPNGIDCQEFRPDPLERRRVRREWGVGDRETLVGMVSRLDPVKNHWLFLRAAERVVASRPDVRFVCVGGGDPHYAQALRAYASELNVADRVVWTGERIATRAVYSAFDVAVLSSDEGESFPNVLVEAMACGTPCVATHSGDAADIIGDSGAVVPPRDATALAAAVLEVLARLGAPGRDLSVEARARVERHYSVERLIDRTEAALTAIVATSDVRPASRWRRPRVRGPSPGAPPGSSARPAHRTIS